MSDRRLIMAVDGNSLVHRSFHAQAATGTRLPDGRPVWAVRGLLSQLVTAVERLDPDVVVVGFDDCERSWRRETWPTYKATRTDKLESLVEQLAMAIDVLRELGIAVVVPAGLEADDVLASTAALAPTLGAETVVVTSDRDAFALIDTHTSVLRIINGGVEASPLLTPDRLVTLLGVRPEQYRDYAALRGDASDNLPGVCGIGPKTAAKLLTELGSARAAFDDIAAGGRAVQAAIGAGATRRLTDPAARPAWELNCQVMTMRTDVGLAIDLDVGPGVLPLAGQAVRAAYTSHQLSFTLPGALRALAREQVAGPVVPRAYNDGAFGWSSPARYPRLPVAARARPQVEQLALFD